MSSFSNYIFRWVFLVQREASDFLFFPLYFEVLETEKNLHAQYKAFLGVLYPVAPETASYAVKSTDMACVNLDSIEIVAIFRSGFS